MKYVKSIRFSLQTTRYKITYLSSIKFNMKNIIHTCHPVDEQLLICEDKKCFSKCTFIKRTLCSALRSVIFISKNDESE